MSYRVVIHLRWIILAAALLVLLSACGINTSGEPKIIREQEIAAQPTRPPTNTPSPTTPPTPDEATALATGSPEAAEPEDASGGADVPAAAYDLGFQVYMRECAACHGAAEGVGPSLTAMRDRAPTVVAGLSAQDYIRQSIVEPGAFVVEGYQDVMPKNYGETLTAEEIDGLITFILEFDPANMMGAAAEAETGEATAEALPTLEQEATLTVQGRLVQGTAGGEVIPAGLPMQLYALDVHGNLAGIYESESAEGGAFTFEDVARAVGNIYLVQVTYDGVAQGAQVPAINGDEETVTQDITVYERTTDTSTIAITWAQMLINYAPIEQFGLEVWLRLELANTGDRIVTLDETAGPNNWYVSVEIDLPPAAFGIQPMQAEDSQRYTVEVVDGVPVVRDTWPLRPGQVHTVTVAYYLPYEDGAVIDQAFGYPVVDGAVLLPNDTVTLSSEQIDEAGAWRYRVSAGGVRVTELAPDEKINPDKDFSLVKEHPLTKSLAADERLVFELVGRPTRTASVMATSPASGGSDTNAVPLLLAVAGVLIIGAAGLLWLRQRRTLAGVLPALQADADGWQAPPADADKSALLAAVAALDDAFESGDLDGDVYRERRALLMQRLLPLMGEDK
ncbi:MAG: cytochrome c [Anaerolineae bacterium]|nr:cytochrome c [Anaerolineae bacterium]